MYFQLTNLQKRTANLYLLGLKKPVTHKTVIQTPEGPVEPESQTIVSRRHDWAKGLTPEQIAENLITSDPEIQNPTGGPSPIGKPIEIKSRVFLDANNAPVSQFTILEDRFKPDGTLKESKPYKPTDANIEIPVAIATKGNLKTEEFPRKLVVHKIFQVIHTDSLGYDFLMDLCKTLQTSGFVRLGAGLKGNEPLILRREGLPAFAYLRGRVEGDKYCCTLHLTYQELKTPALAAAPAA